MVAKGLPPLNAWQWLRDNAAEVKRDDVGYIFPY